MQAESIIPAKSFLYKDSFHSRMQTNFLEQGHIINCRRPAFGRNRISPSLAIKAEDKLKNNPEMNYLERLRTSLPAASRHSADYVNGLRQKSSFLKGNSGLLVIWPIVAVLIATVGWGSLLQGMEQQKREIEETALKEAATLAHAYAGQLERTIEAVDQILLHVRYEWELTNGKLRLEDSSQRGLLPRPTIFNIGITDFQGNILTNAPKISDAISVSDRPFFYEQKNSPEDTLYVSHTTQSKTTGQSVINFSRKVFARQKLFDGVVRVSVTPEYLTSSYNDVALSANGFIATLSTDRMLLASRIGDKVFGLQNHPLIKIPSFAKSGGSMLLKGSEWFTDGRSRYIGWQKLDNLPLIAMTGMDKEDMLSQFSHSRDKAIAQALLNTMVLAAFTLAAMGLSLRLAWRKHQVNLTQAAYRIATESGNEGFLSAGRSMTETRALSISSFSTAMKTVRIFTAGSADNFWEPGCPSYIRPTSSNMRSSA